MENLDYDAWEALEGWPGDRHDGRGRTLLLPEAPISRITPGEVYQKNSGLRDRLYLLRKRALPLTSTIVDILLTVEEKVDTLPGTLQRDLLLAIDASRRLVTILDRATRIGDYGDAEE